MKKNIDHLKIITDLDLVRQSDPRISHMAESGCCYCENCGEHYNMTYPISSNRVAAITKAFTKDHRSCKKPKIKKD